MVIPWLYITTKQKYGATSIGGWFHQDGCSSSLDFFVVQGCGNTATRSRSKNMERGLKFGGSMVLPCLALRKNPGFSMAWALQHRPAKKADGWANKMGILLQPRSLVFVQNETFGEKPPVKVLVPLNNDKSMPLNSKIPITPTKTRGNTQLHGFQCFPMSTYNCWVAVCPHGIGSISSC